MTERLDSVSADIEQIDAASKIKKNDQELNNTVSAFSSAKKRVLPQLLGTLPQIFSPQNQKTVGLKSEYPNTDTKIGGGKPFKISVKRGSSRILFNNPFD